MDEVVKQTEPDGVKPETYGATTETGAADDAVHVRPEKQCTIRGKACIVQWVSTPIFVGAAVYIMAAGSPSIDSSHCDLAGVAFISCAICWCEALGQSFLAAATWWSDAWE